ncbi:MAG: tetratricopeptide repeat protein [Dissulfurispiraceae bacterium]
MKNKGKKTNKLIRHNDLPPAHASFSPLSLTYNSFVHIACLSLLILIIYSNALNVPFQWDEEMHIVNEPIIKDLNYFLHPSTAQGFENYRFFISRYISHLTFALNYRINGLSVTGYHIVNIAIHIANTILVYLLVLLTFRTPYMKGIGHRAKGTPSQVLNFSSSGNPAVIAFFSAALFAVHPLQTAAVTYVMQRYASLAAFFYLLSLTAYIKFRLEAPDHHKARRRTMYAISLLSAVLAMKTKENAFTLPFVITLYEFCFFNGGIKKRMLVLAPLLLSLCIIPLTIMSMPTVTEVRGTQLINPSLIDPGSYMAGFTWDYSRGEYFFTQFRVIVTYLRMLFFPANLELNYEYPVFKSFFQPQVSVSFVFLSALFGLGIYLVQKKERRGLRTEGEGLRTEWKGPKEEGPGLRTKGKGLRAKREDENSVLASQSSSLSPQSSVLASQSSALSPAFRLMGFGILWFFITLSVESSIIPTPRLIETYRMYLPSVGVIICTVTGVFLLKEKIRSQKAGNVILVTLALIISILSVAAHLQNNLYGDSKKMWEDTVKRFPRYANAHARLGNFYKSRNMLDNAIEQYIIAIKLKPDYAEAHNNLGIAYHAINMPDKSIEQYLIAIKLAPDYAEAHFNLGLVYYDSDRLDKAKNEFETALRLRPDIIENARIQLMTRLKIKPDDQKTRQLLNEILP